MRPTFSADAEVDLAVTIARQLGFSFERMRAEEALREAQARLAVRTRRHAAAPESAPQLIHENNAEALYEKILDAAVAIMRSDFASMQMLYRSGVNYGSLAFRGFNPQRRCFGSGCGQNRAALAASR